MPGLGTIVNVAAIILGGVIGMLAGKKLSERFQQTLMMAIGVATIFIGAGGAFSRMFLIEGGAISVRGTLMVIISLALGGFIGELINLDRHMETFGNWLKRKTGNSREATFTEGFVTASLTVCIGAMAVIGSIEDGISSDHSILFAKSVLDFIIIVIMSSVMGKGCAFSAIPVGIFQGAVTALAVVIKPLITDAVISNLSYVGSILIFCVGINLVFGKKIRVANLLPAIVFAVALSFVPLSFLD